MGWRRMNTTRVLLAVQGSDRLKGRGDLWERSPNGAESFTSFRGYFAVFSGVEP